MTVAREIGVGLLGLGNVGSGVVKILSDNAAAIEARLGARIVVRRIAVRDEDKPRVVEVPRELLTTDASAVVDDPGVEIVVELIGGAEPARTLVRRAIDRGQHIVTANKLLLALHGEELLAAAERAGVDVYHEAAVCGGVPVLRALREGLASDRIESLVGIVNGTSNYILTAMADRGQAFDAVLAEAQAAGYAEADPALDVDGGDAAHKLAILAMVAFGVRVPPGAISVDGIRSLAPIDFRYAERFGYVIKPLVVARDHADGLELRVHPAMVPRRHLLASVLGVNNAVLVTSQALGESAYIGRGAGMMPTAVAVVSDTIDVARDILASARGAATRKPLGTRAERPARDPGLLRGAYYLRFGVVDRPGVLAQLAGVLGEHDISIAQVVQESRQEPDRPVPVVVVTHAALERDVRAALGRIDALPAVLEPTRLIRMLA